MIELLLSLINLAEAQAGPPELLTPSDVLAVALTDARNLPAERRTYARWLSLSHLTVTEREAAWQSLSFLLNSLSRERTLTRPALLQGSVVRVLLDDYRISASAWDRLITQGSGPAASRAPEPYFYLTVDVLEDQPWGYYDRYGRWVQTEIRKKRSKRLAAAPWLTGDGGKAYLELTRLTGTKYPIAHGGWWSYHAALAPAYYDLLGVGDKLADFEGLIFADRALAEKARVQVKGVVVRSVVTLNNRALYRMPTISGVTGGYYWYSRDTLSSVGVKDYVQVILGEIEDGGEFIGSLPNGLQAYFIANAKGNRLDVAPADLAQDTETQLHDRQVWTARNCMYCHAGLRAVQDRIRQLGQGDLTLLAQGSPERLRTLQDLFGTPIEPVIAHDNALFAQAVRSVNGLEPAANARLLADLHWSYKEADVTPAIAARELGVPVARVQRAAGRGPNISHTLAALGRAPALPVRREHFEAALPELYGLLAQVP